MAIHVGYTGKPAAIARSASSCGGWGREGARSEVRAEQRLAPGGPQAPITRISERLKLSWLRAAITEGQLLWEPTESFKARSRMAEYMRWLAKHHHTHF